jgi:type IV pilus assembly protein PilA
MSQVRNKKKKGFTLVELIVVIGILLVLSVLATVAYNNLAAQAEIAGLRSDAATLARALNVYNSLITNKDERILTIANLNANANSTDTVSLKLATSGTFTSGFSPGLKKGLINLDSSVTLDDGRLALIARTGTGGWLEISTEDSVWSTKDGNSTPTSGS